MTVDFFKKLNIFLCLVLAVLLVVLFKNQEPSRFGETDVAPRVSHTKTY